MLASRIAAFAVLLYAMLLAAAGRMAWHHVGLAALAWVLVSGRPGARRFVREWWPLLVFWVGYDALRLLEPWLLPRVQVRAPYDWEASLFKAPARGIWPFYFAGMLERAGSAAAPAVLRIFCSIVYLTQLWAVPVLMLTLWLRGRTEVFRRLLGPFAVVSLATLALYLLYPAAPPWWVYENGFAQPAIDRSFPGAASRTGIFGALFHMSPNRFAAIPSLHGAYPLLLTLILAAAGVRYRWIIAAGLYTLSMWSACVILNQHYIVDLLLGVALVPFALWAGARFPRAGPDDSVAEPDGTER